MQRNREAMKVEMKATKNLMTEQHEMEIDRIRQERQTNKFFVQQEYDQKRRVLQMQFEQELKRQINAVQRKLQNNVTAAQQQHNSQLTAAQQQHNSQLTAAQQRHNIQLKAAQQELKSARKQILDLKAGIFHAIATNAEEELSINFGEIVNSVNKGFANLRPEPQQQSSNLKLGELNFSRPTQQEHSNSRTQRPNYTAAIVAEPQQEHSNSTTQLQNSTATKLAALQERLIILE